MKSEDSRSAMDLPPECMRLPKVTVVTETVTESKSVKTFFLKCSDIAGMAKPGQFVMLGIFNGTKNGESEEIPLSLSYIMPESDLVGVTVKKAGKTTEILHEYGVDDEVTIRGPYGNGYNVEGLIGRVGIVGGGVGIVSLAPLVEKLVERHSEVTVFLGARTKGDLIFHDRIRNTGVTLIVTTEDGSFGARGLIVEGLRTELAKNGYDHIVTCGRELMMKKVLELADKYEIDCQVSLERYIKCGRGICGHCAINDYLVCKDGPVFSGDVVRSMKDFGKIQLDESGAPVELTF